MITRTIFLLFSSRLFSSRPCRISHLSLYACRFSQYDAIATYTQRSSIFVLFCFSFVLLISLKSSIHNKPGARILSVPSCLSSSISFFSTLSVCLARSRSILFLFGFVSLTKVFLSLCLSLSLQLCTK